VRLAKKPSTWLIQEAEFRNRPVEKTVPHFQIAVIYSETSAPSW